MIRWRKCSIYINEKHWEYDIPNLRW